MTEAADVHGSSPFAEVDEVPESALRVYARLWQFETWLRRMVYIELRALLGDEWSKSLQLNQRSFDADKYLTHMPTPEMNALSYSQLRQLTDLISTHWHCFERYLPPRAIWDAKLQEVSQIRHRVAHFRVGHTDDYPRLIQFLRDLDKGFWQFCTSYNNANPILPQSDDRVTAHFLSLDPLPWAEVKHRKWARVGFVDHSLIIGMTVDVLTRTWSDSTNHIDGVPGHLYDVLLMARDQRNFDYPRLLESTGRLHDHFVHICLSESEDSIRIIIPSVLGATKIIELLEETVRIARYNVGRGRSPLVPKPDAIAAEWPEYVLGPSDPLSFLSPEMKGSFFNV